MRPRVRRAPALLAALLAWALLLLACTPGTPSDPPRRTEPLGPAAAATTAAAPGGPVHLAEAMRRIHFAFRADGDAFSGGHSTYAARAGAAELRVTPWREGDGDGKPATAPLVLVTESIARGDAPLALRAPGARLEEGALVVDRGAAVERLENTELGVEQSFAFRARPAGSGDLTVRIRATGETYRGATEGGHHFVDPATGLGVRYGAATWVDAAGRRTKVTAAFAEGAITLTVPAAALEASAYPAVLDPTVGPEIVIDNPMIEVAATADQAAPAVAYGGGNYLVVWQDRRGGTFWQLYGTRVSPAGVVLDPGGLVLGTSSTNRTGPAVAYNGTSFLVAWYDDTYFSGVYAELVSPAGAVLGATPIKIANVGLSPAATAGTYSVASDGNSFLVSYLAGHAWAQLVSAAGVPATPQIVFTVSPGLTGINTTAASFAGSQYLVVYNTAGSNGSSYYLQAQRVSQTGVVDFSYAVLCQSPNGPTTHFGVASNGTDWFVSWTPNASTKVYGARVVAATAATPDGPNGVLLGDVGVAPSNVAVAYAGGAYVAFANSAADVFGMRVGVGGAAPSVAAPVALLGGEGGAHTQVAASSDGTNLLFAFHDTGYATNVNDPGDIRGERVSAGNPLARLDAPSVLYSVTAPTEQHPAVAWDGADWLVVWDDTRQNPKTHVYGTRVDPLGNVLDPSGIGIVTYPSNQTVPSVAWNGAEFLVVWQDDRAGVGQDDIYGARVLADGTAVDPNGFAVNVGAGLQGEPAVASDGSGWLVAWETSPSANVYSPSGTIVSAAGVVQTPGGTVISTSNGVKPIRPAVGYNGSSYLVAWGNLGIGYRRVSPAGVVLDGSDLGAGQGNYQYGPTVTGDGTNWLVSWTYNNLSAGTFILQAKRISPAGVALDSTPISVDPSGGGDKPSATWDGTQYWIAYHRGGVSMGVSSSDIWVAQLSSAGAVTAPFDVAGTTDNEVSPAIAAGPLGEILVAYQHGDGTPGVDTTRTRARIVANPPPTTPCAQPSDCPAGLCVDGFCCNTACNGACQACSAAKKGQGFDGVCGAVAAGLDPDSECGDQGAPTCGTTGVCNGAGACQLYASGTSCGAAVCVGNDVEARRCDGAGTCVTGSSSAGDCAPYVCGGGACKNPCAAGSDCVSGYACLAGVCTLELPQGASCTTSALCQSGSCVDGVCCDAGCAGACQACTTAKKGQGVDGVCGPVAAGFDPDGECGDQGATSCGTDGACNGSGACQLYAQGTSCGPSVCQGGVARPETCDGVGACVAGPGGQSCSPYACATGACLTVCATAADCAAGFVCAAGACVPPQPSGAPCGSGAECQSGSCADGVCCDTACAGLCEACSAAKKGSGVDGACGPIAAGADPDSECNAQTQASCGLTGQCDGAGACQRYPQGTSCGGSVCQGTVRKGQVCDGAGTCGAAAGGQDCAPYACSGGSCKSPCAVTGDCAPGFVCNLGACQPPASSGAACASGAACQSGFCVDGVCCNAACGGLCQACSTAKKGSGNDGVCGPIVAGSDPDGECAQAPQATCKLTGQCDGAGACQRYASGTACGASVCSGDLVSGQICDGNGACITAQTGTDCAPYVCSGGSCVTPCVAASDCVAGYFCLAGACTPVGMPGAPCGSAAACQSGFCVDGVCCDGACTGLCSACSAAKKGQGLDGQCGPAAAGLDPDDECADQGASSCGASGVCDGSGACALYAAGSVCAAGSCSGTTVTQSSTCDGNGVCLQGGTTTCAGGYACSGAACASTCAGDADCAHGYLCDPAGHTCGMQPVDAGTDASGTGGGDAGGDGGSDAGGDAGGDAGSDAGTGGQGGQGGATSGSGSGGQAGSTTGSASSSSSGGASMNGGCGCRTAGDEQEGPPTGALLAAALLLVAPLRRRRARLVLQRAA